MYKSSELAVLPGTPLQEPMLQRLPGSPSPLRIDIDA